MPRHFNYYEIDLDDQWTCDCGTGFQVGEEMELHDSLYDVHCPSCGKMVLIVSLPTPQETREAAAAGNPRAVADLDDANWVESWRERVAELELKSASQLPEIDAEEISLRFDLVKEMQAGEKEYWFSITENGREIWRELAVYEGVPRYSALRTLLEERYTPRPVEIEVGEGASNWLLGDKYWKLPE